MSEAGAGGQQEVWKEEQFGHVVLQTDLGQGFFFNLYTTFETREAVAAVIRCRGHYLPPTDEIVDLLRRRWPRVGFQALPSSVPVEVEWSFDAAAQNELYEMLSYARLRDERIPMLSFEDWERPFSGDFALRGPERQDFHSMHLELSPTIYGPGRSTWAGELYGRGTQAAGQFRFVLVQYGTIEPLLLLMFLFLAGFREDPAQAAERCRQQALIQCGDAGNIKVVNASASLTGETFSLSGGCHIECFERWDPA